MVFLNVALCGLILGRVLGGRLSNLADIAIKGKGLAFGAIGLQLVAFPSELLPWSTPSGLARALWLISYALLIWMLVKNRALPGAAIVAGGLACNLIAILANHGLMPVRPGALEATGVDYQVHNNSIQLGHAHLPYLIDRWAVPSWVPLANVFSVGDVLIALGTIVAIAAAMRTQSGASQSVEPRQEPDPLAVTARQSPA